MELTLEEALRRGLEAHNSGEIQEADRYYTAILSTDPKHPDANYNMAILAVGMGKSEQALPFFKTAIGANPTVEQFWISYIKTLLDLNRVDEAETGFNEASGNGLKGNIFDQLADLIKQQQVNVSIPVNQDPLPQQLQPLIALFNQGYFQQALAQAEQLLEQFPNSVVLHNLQGAGYAELGDLRAAIDSYKWAIKIKPDSAAAYNNMGNALKATGELDEAISSCRQAVKIKPEYAEAYSNMGNALKEKGELDEAISSYRQAIKIKPNYAKAYNNMGVALQKNGALDESIISFREAIKIKPDYAEAYSNMGNALKEKGELDEAISSYTQAIKIKPDDAIARINLNNAASAAVPAWHLTMMNDESRNNAYFEAIQLAVDDGSFVLDIGTGSGLLSMMAAASGAGEVITCETSKTIADMAKKIICSNGYGNTISVLNKKSTELIIGKDLPQAADLVISEVLSAEFVGEGVRSTILDAKKRLLKTNGTMIPQSGSIRVSLLGNNPEILNAVTLSGSHGFDLSAFSSISQRKFFLNLKDKPLLLSTPEDAFCVNFYDENEITEQEKFIQLRANKDGLCLGLIQWLKVQLYKGIEYENNPGENFSHWPTPLYIFDEPIALKMGDVLEIRAFLGEDSLWFHHLK